MAISKVHTAKSTARITVQRAKENVKILLMDSDIDFLMLLEQCLRAEGYSTVHITTSHEASGFAPLFLPDLILCSVSMASYLLEVLSKIRVHRPAVIPKVLVLSNHGTLEDIRYAMKLGADDCISKTVSPEIIILAIEALFDAKR